MSESVKVDCPHCGVRIQSPIAGSLTLNAKGQGDPTAFILTHCEECDLPILCRLMQDFDERGFPEWDSIADRLWPDSFESKISYSVPDDCRKDLINAHRCLASRIAPAAVVMAGRAVERWVRDTTGEKTLKAGLMKLKEEKVIDDRLYSWAEALREERNIGAHAGESEVTLEDARDVVDFAAAIFDYVFNLSEKYNKYMQRKPAK